MAQREQILARMEASVLDFVSERPNSDFNTITAHFGTPKQIVISCLEGMDGEELARELAIKKKVIGVAVSVGAIVVLLWGSVVFSALMEHNDNAEGFYVEQIVNVTEIQNKVEGE